MGKEIFEQLQRGRITRRAFLKGLGLGVGTVALSGWSASAASASPRSPRSGRPSPSLGRGASSGRSIGTQPSCASGKINEAANEVFGGPIMEIIIEDDATTPSIGVDRARKLVEVDGVPVLISTWSSGWTIAIAESVTMPAKILHIVPIATSPLIAVLPADTDDLLFRTDGSDALQGVVAAQLAAGEIIPGYKFKTAATIYVNNPYGQGLSNVFSRSFQLRGGLVTAQVPIPDEPKPTYTSELALALKDKPEVLLPMVYPGHGTILLSESRDIFGYTSWQFCDALKSLEVFNALGGELLDGKLGTVQAADYERASFQRFAADYKAAYGEPPPYPYMDTTYDAVAAAGLAIAKAVADGVPITPFNLRDRLRPVCNPPGEVVE
jgi:branched-chain amino acid transport system substrate-binding protein